MERINTIDLSRNTVQEIQSTSFDFFEELDDITIESFRHKQKPSQLLNELPSL